MTKMLSVRLDSELVEAVTAIRRAEGRARSEVVREGLELWLSRRRLRAKVDQHRRGYQRRRVEGGEFGPVLAAQRGPK